MKQGDTRCPRVIFVEQFGNQLKQWRADGDRLLVFLDGNENLQHGNLYKLFTSEELKMQDLVEKRSGSRGPATYAKGITQIDGAFATRDIICSGARYLPLWAGIGDHRPIVIDIPSECLYGIETLRIERPLARRLQCKFPKCQEKYSRKLEYFF